MRQIKLPVTQAEINGFKQVQYGGANLYDALITLDKWAGEYLERRVKNSNFELRELYLTFSEKTKTHGLELTYKEGRNRFGFNISETNMGVVKIWGHINKTTPPGKRGDTGEQGEEYPLCDLSRFKSLKDAPKWLKENPRFYFNDIRWEAFIKKVKDD